MLTRLQRRARETSEDNSNANDTAAEHQTFQQTTSEQTKMTDKVKEIKTFIYKLDIPADDYPTREHGVQKFLAITFPVRQNIRVLPKDQACNADIITEAEMFSTNSFNANNYIFDKKELWKFRQGKNGKVLYYSTSIRVEGEASLYEMKSNNAYFDLLHKYGMYVSARKNGPTLATVPIGWIKHVNADHCCMQTLQHQLEALLENEIPDPYIYVAKRREVVHLKQNKKTYTTIALRAFSTIEHADQIREIITNKLKHNTMGRIRLIACSRDSITQEESAMHFQQQNKFLHDTSLVEVKNVWATDRTTQFSLETQERFNLDEADMVDDEGEWMSHGVRDLLATMIVRNTDYELRDVYYRGGKMIVVTEKDYLKKAVRHVNEFIEICKNHFGPIKFAKMCGNNDPSNFARHPRLAQTVLYGEEGVIQLQSNDIDNEDLRQFRQQEGLEAPLPPKKYNLNRPPAGTQQRRGRERIEKPGLTKPNAAAIWRKFREEAPTSQDPTPKPNAPQPKKPSNDAPIQPTSINQPATTTVIAHDTPNETETCELQRSIANLKAEQKRQKNDIDGRMKALKEASTSISEVQRQIQRDLAEYKKKDDDFKLTIQNQVNYLSAQVTELIAFLTREKTAEESIAMISEQTEHGAKRKAVSPPSPPSPVPSPDSEDSSLSAPSQKTQQLSQSVFAGARSG
jgi:hypothetical protein